MTNSDISPVLEAVDRGDTPAAALRRDGLVPLELYGRGKDNRHLAAAQKEVARLLRQAGETTLIDLRVGENSTRVLFTEPQWHPQTHALLHLDLHAVNLKEKITAEVPLVFTGLAPAVDTLGGTLIESKQEVEVECLPTDLPHELSVDVSTLSTFDDVLRVSDVILPAGVELLSDPDEVICSIQEPRSEEELAALDEKIEEVDVEEAVAVDEKGKAEDEDAAEDQSE